MCWDEKRHVAESSERAYQIVGDPAGTETVCGLWVEADTLAYRKSAIDAFIDSGGRWCRSCVRLFYRRWHESRGLVWTEEFTPA